MVMGTLVIYGAGGLGREILDLSRKINKKLKRWSDILFVDDNKKQNVINDAKVYTFEEILFDINIDIRYCEFVIATGEPEIRYRLYKKLLDEDFYLTNIISPNAEISEYADLGKGNIIFDGCIIGPNVCMGDNNVIYAGGFLGHDCNMGNNCVLCPNVKIGGDTFIDNNVFLGIGSSVRNALKIKEYAVIGMGAVIISNIEKDWIMAGNPGRKIGINKERQIF